MLVGTSFALVKLEYGPSVPFVPFVSEGGIEAVK
jgi:hypothetical protein